MMSSERRMAGLSYVLTEYDDMVRTGRFSEDGSALLAERMHMMSAHWADMRDLPWGGADDHDNAVADAKRYRQENLDAIAEFIMDFDRRHAKKGDGK